ncbi:MAG TPA: SRPBCC family protein [Meiothermus sp.]|nr:SRPBCC family protein [Meiothermus sp.]
MAGNDYVFVDRWRVRGSVQEVSDIIGDAAGFASWWPAFVLGGEQVEAGDASGVGAVYAWRLKGWLPYVVRFKTRVLESHPPHGYSIEAFGDLTGRGVWSFEQDGEWVNVTYDWRVSADRPLLRYGSFIAKPLLASNHRWAMLRGEESLKLELERRRAQTPEERSRIPAPPAPVPPSPWASLRAGLELLRQKPAPQMAR